MIGKLNKIMLNTNYKLLLIIILFLGCNTTAEKKDTLKFKSSKKNTTIDDRDHVSHRKVLIPKFNADSAYYFIEKQVSFGPRFISSKGWEKCAVWLEKKMQEYTPHVIIQKAPIKTYDKKNHILKNIIASFSPEENHRIALFAHWDTRHIADHDVENQESPILGANDGGSGVAVLLEIARQFHILKPKIGVDIILFDAEDYGQPENSNYPIMKDSWWLGSQYWSKKPHKEGYFAYYGILLDMVGAKNATFRHEYISSYYASHILEKVWKKAHQLGFGKHFIFENAPQIMDDHYYVNLFSGIPTIDIIEHDPTTKTNFNKHWHTHKDDMNNIDKNTLTAVGQTLIEIIYTE